ncbi:hypothetical protein [Vagococcus fluvialis]|uniref:hypothetical protein n=1 Tax=Vagococcus fluvialis TaxID=2738 RepID=UPI001D0A880A|nr:hypothetical protein [Vagococcus fluvialis]UDM72681.1 hypothetical protein K5L00_14945 [Vagococcus fluvialis]UDM78404.1 hypothetical protein K5K98_14280 [Vagococcus fluvialis]UDM83956.1 hypothetical protein K5K96_14970 [Vagococcus fluvialis]
MENRLKDLLREHINLHEQRTKLESSITAEEISENYTYEDKPVLDEILELASGCKAYWLSSKIKQALNTLKEEAYPEINGVRYYKKYLDQLKTPVSEEVLLQIDRSLNENFKPSYIYSSLRSDLGRDESKVLKELFEMGVISPAVEFPQMCSCWSGGSKYLGNRLFNQTVYEFFGIEDGDDDKLLDSIGIIECDNCGDEHCLHTEHDLEMIKDQFENCGLFRFKVVAEPDRSLDEV